MSQNETTKFIIYVTWGYIWMCISRGHNSLIQQTLNIDVIPLVYFCHQPEGILYGKKISFPQNTWLFSIF